MMTTMMIEITFKNLFVDDLLGPTKLDYHGARVLPMLRRLNVKVWRGDSLEQLSAELMRFNMWASPNGLRHGLRDLMDYGAIDLKPDPRFEPLV